MCLTTACCWDWTGLAYTNRTNPSGDQLGGVFARFLLSRSWAPLKCLLRIRVHAKLPRTRCCSLQLGLVMCDLYVCVTKETLLNREVTELSQLLHWKCRMLNLATMSPRLLLRLHQELLRLLLLLLVLARAWVAGVTCLLDDGHERGERVIRRGCCGPTFRDTVRASLRPVVVERGGPPMRGVTEQRRRGREPLSQRCELGRRDAPQRRH